MIFKLNNMMKTEKIDMEFYIILMDILIKSKSCQFFKLLSLYKKNFNRPFVLYVFMKTKGIKNSKMKKI